MAFISVSNTFSNGTTADATQVNTNFSDIIAGLSDGTKDISISALTVAGTATLNGNMVFGNAAGDTITVTGTPTFATQLSAALGSASAPAYSFTGDLNTGMYSSGADLLELVTGGTARVQLGASTGTLGSTSYPFYMFGRIDGASPTTGTIGQYMESVQSTATTTGPKNIYGDGTELAITKGEWDLSAACDWGLADASSVTAVIIGISTTSGNSSSGLTFGNNAFSAPGPTASADVPLYVPAYRVSVSTTTTYYLKLRTNYTTGTSTPTVAFHFRARRVG